MLLRALALAVLGSTAALPAQPPQTDEARAKELLERGERFNAEGKHAVAVGAYEKLAKQYPRTLAGQLAALRTEKNAVLGWSYLVESGPSSNRVDVVIMGDGYTLEQQNQLDDIAKFIPEIFENHKLLGEYYAYHDFIRMNVRSAEDGVDGFGREFDTALGGKILPTAQGHVGVDSGLVHEALAQIPSHDGLAFVFVKTGSHGTGGSGVAAIGGRADDIVVHEWGHAFAGLGDEYSSFTGPRGPVGEGTPNLSPYDDPKRVPWRHMIAANVPKVGVYRGGNGQVKGAWKPVASGCAMEGGELFCPVCREAVILRIHDFVDPIDACKPAAHKTAARDQPLRTTGDALEFTVEIMQPTSHGLDVKWYVLAEKDVPRPADEGSAKRRDRGPLAKITASPAKSVPNARQRVQQFSFKPEFRQKGLFRVVCRVLDDTKVAGQTVPWVIADPRGLLESERAWWVMVQGP